MKNILLITVILILTVISSCKKPPTFQSDNPNDISSELYVLASPENVDIEFNGEYIILKWSTDHFNEYETNSSFLIEVIIDDAAPEQILETEFTNSVELDFQLFPKKVYQFVVTTIYKDNTSEPSLSNVLDLSFTKPFDVSIQDHGTNQVGFFWSQSNSFKFSQEVIFKDINTGAVETYLLDPNPYYGLEFYDLNIGHEYQIEISQFFNGVKSEPTTFLLTFSDGSNLNKTFSFDKTNEGISFWNPVYVPNTDYILTTDSYKQGIIYLIDIANNTFEKLIDTNLGYIGNIVGGTDGSYYFYSSGSIYKGNINSNSYELYLANIHHDTSLSLFGLINQHDLIYYSGDDGLNFYDTTSESTLFRIDNYVDHICVSYMEDQFITIKNNVLEYYTLPEMQLQDTYTAPIGTYFFSCEFSDMLNTVFVSGSSTNSSNNFFASLIKGKNLSDFSIISEETGFENLYLFQRKTQILISTFNPEVGELHNSPFYIYNYETKTLKSTSATYNGLNAPNYSYSKEGYFLYSTDNPSGVIEESYIVEDWILIEE